MTTTMIITWFAAILTLAQAASTIGFDPIVATKTALLTGTSEETPLGAVNKFLGVPYAKAPTGWLRFRAPQAAEESDARLDVKKFKPSCIQPGHMLRAMHPVLRAEEKKLTEVSEDCLFLNIYVPKINGQSDDLPVIVWIPGEGFDFAKANQFDGTDLALAAKSIVVTVNYRVSVLGFFTTEDHHVPGNMGILDQQMALEWIQKNIDAFGGNPSKVTLTGRFTGSMSIAIHLVSPLNENQGYFSRAILQSGVPTGSYVFGNTPKNGTVELANAVGCQSQNIAEIMDCLRRVDAELLVQKALENNQRWAPVIDGSYLLEDPMKAVENGRYQKDVRVIFGMNSDEGSMCLLMHQFLETPYQNKIISNSIDSEDLSNMMKQNLEDYFKVPIKGLDTLSQFQYSRQCSRVHRMSNRLHYIDFCSDMYFKSAIVRMADAMSNHGSKVWLYEFRHRPTSSIYPRFVTAAHGDDVLFSLGLISKADSVTYSEENLSFLMMKTFGNFAKFGSPKDVNGVQWPLYDSHKQSYFQWTTKTGQQSVRRQMKTSEMLFWNTVMPKLL